MTKSVSKFSSGMIAALLFAVFAFGASIVMNRTVFERLPHLEDEFAYLYQAKLFARGQAWVKRDEAVKVFWQPFVLQPETSPDGTLRRFGKYTPGWPLLLAAGVANETPWIVNAFAAMLNVLLIYRLGKDIFDETVGLVAAALMAISPMALILNATLMSHTSALTCTLLFIYSYYRTTKTQRGLGGLLRWGAVGGVALGVLVSMRPLTAVAMAAPTALHILARLMEAFTPEKKAQLVKMIAPLVLMGMCVLPWIGLLFAFNYAVTGQVRSELYTLQWEYDKPGFGEGYGLMPGGHSLTYGWRNFNADLYVWQRDLLGWTLHPALEGYLKDNLNYGVGVGLAYLFIALGLIAGRKNEWVWLLFELLIALFIAQLTYWIGSAVYGSAVYSVRYYYEATGGVILVIAFGLVAQARMWSPRVQAALAPSADTVQTATLAQRIRADLGRAWLKLWPGYVLITAAIVVSVFGYLPSRLSEPLRGWPNGLYGYNKVGQYQLRNLEKVREPGKKVLIVVLRNPDPSVEDDWRDYGAAMAETSPFLDSDIVVARLFDTDGLDEFKQRFADRQVIYQVGEKLFTTLDAALQKTPDTPPTPDVPATEKSEM